MSEAMWFFTVVGGPILLIAAIIWFTVRNKTAGQRNFDRAERGARELRQELERDPDYREK